MNNSSNILRLALIFVLALILQIVVIDNLEFLTFCNPFIYIVFILSLPFGISPITAMLLALPAGLAVDFASNTPGMHAAACVLIAYLRQPILNLIAFRNSYREGDIPSIYSYGLVWYLKYTVLMVSIHHVALFLIEQYDSFFVLPTLLRIVLSIIASTLVILLFQIVMPSGRSNEEV